MPLLLPLLFTIDFMLNFHVYMKILTLKSLHFQKAAFKLAQLTYSSLNLITLKQLMMADFYTKTAIMWIWVRLKS